MTYPVADREQAEELVAEGILTPDRWVTVYSEGAGSRGRRVLATELVQLRSLFPATELATPAPEPVAALAAAPLKGPWDKPTEVSPETIDLVPASVSVPTVKTQKPASVLPSQPPSNPLASNVARIVDRPGTAPEKVSPTGLDNEKSGSSWKPFAVIGAILLALALWYNSGGSGKPVWTIRSATLFDQPEGMALATLPRGEALSVEKPEGKPWLRIADGDHAGKFVRAEDIIEVQPPAIDTSIARTFRIRNRLTVRAGMDENSEPLASLTRRDRLRIVGQVIAPAVAGNWIEVSLPDGRVGYVPGEALGIKPRSAASAAAIAPTTAGATSTAAADAAIAAAAEAARVAGRQPAPTEPLPAGAKRDRCSRAGDASRQMLCRHPDLAALDQQMVGEYGASLRVGVRPDMLGPSPDQWRRTTGCDLDHACLANAYRARIDTLVSERPRAVSSMKNDASGTFVATPPRPLSRQLDLSGEIPPSAMRAGVSGRTAYSAEIDARGRVSSCRVTASSGNAALDEATCKVVKRRVRFQPAKDSSGREVPGTFSSALQWNLAN